MKHAVLTAVAHNIADSLASGIGLLIGDYTMDVFGEAARSPQGFITVDFLTGATEGAEPSWSLARSVRLYANALPEFCTKHGVEKSDFRTLTARYSSTALTVEFTVEVVDCLGRRSQDRYAGIPGSRPKVLDARGRVRRQRIT